MSTSVLDRRSTGPQKPVAVVDSRSAEPKRLYTPQEYLALERKAEFKSEFYQGEIIPMAGTSFEHNQIHRNFIGMMFELLGGTGYEFFYLDMRVRTPATNSYAYPDILIYRGKPILEEAERDILLNPCCVIEILSKSTENYDRGRKFDSYRTIETLYEYLLLSQKSIRAELYTRQPNDTWSLTVFEGADGILELTTPPVKIPLAKIYANVEVGDSE